MNHLVPFHRQKHTHTHTHTYSLTGAHTACKWSKASTKICEFMQVLPFNSLIRKPLSQTRKEKEKTDFNGKKSTWLLLKAKLQVFIFKSLNYGEEIWFHPLLFAKEKENTVKESESGQKNFSSASIWIISLTLCITDFFLHTRKYIKPSQIVEPKKKPLYGVVVCMLFWVSTCRNIIFCWFWFFDEIVYTW